MKSKGEGTSRNDETSELKKTKMAILGLRGLLYIQICADFKVQLEL